MFPTFWYDATEGPETWSPFIILGHLIHGERTDWIARARIILDQGDADRELGLALDERPRAVDRVDHPDPAGAVARAVVRALLAQPAVVGPGLAQAVVEQRVDLEIRLRDNLARPLLPMALGIMEVLECQRQLGHEEIKGEST